MKHKSLGFLFSVKFEKFLLTAEPLDDKTTNLKELKSRLGVEIPNVHVTQTPGMRMVQFWKSLRGKNRLPFCAVDNTLYGEGLDDADNNPGFEGKVKVQKL